MALKLCSVSSVVRLGSGEVAHASVQIHARTYKVGLVVLSPGVGGGGVGGQKPGWVEGAASMRLGLM